MDDGYLILPVILLLLVLLKVSGFLTWSWLWIFSPLWGTAIFCIGLCLVMKIYYTITNKE